MEKHATLIDFMKSFDKVFYSELIGKLSSFEICGKLLVWLNGFLTTRTQCVTYKDITFSSWSSYIGNSPGISPRFPVICCNDQWSSSPNCISSHATLRWWRQSSGQGHFLTELSKYSSWLRCCISMVCC